MLLIGDIHINSRYKDKILKALKDFISQHSEEKNLIFLGDFVYHFSYDRNSLLALYDLFLDLYLQGKSLYILAGNHDRLGNSFVFEEARKAFEVLAAPFSKGGSEGSEQGDFVDAQETSTPLLRSLCGAQYERGQGYIHFITKPLITNIEGKQICFLPYMFDIDLADYPGIEQLQDDFYHEQIKTGNKNQILSAKLHLLMQYFTTSSLTIIHHYYFDGIAFPGQQSKFSFRDVALSSQWLDDPNLQFISSHLHQPFYYKNYLCTGSVRAESPLDENDIKGFFSFIDGKFSFYESGVNYYFTLELAKQFFPFSETASSPLSLPDVQAHHQKLQNQMKANFPGLEMEYHFLPHIDLKSVSLSLRVDELNYQKMDQFVDPELQIQLQDVKLKKPKTNVNDLLEKLQKSDSDSLKEGFGGWIDLLKRFLMKQYPDNYQEYEQMLQDLKLV